MQNKLLSLSSSIENEYSYKEKPGRGKIVVINGNILKPIFWRICSNTLENVIL